MFIGRWQPLHKGHLWLINQRLKEGKNIWLAIRDVEPDENNPWTAKEIEKIIHEGELKDLIAKRTAKYFRPEADKYHKDVWVKTKGMKKPVSAEWTDPNTEPQRTSKVINLKSS